jgi:hypothetical protein
MKEFIKTFLAGLGEISGDIVQMISEFEAKSNESVPCRVISRGLPVCGHALDYESHDGDTDLDLALFHSLEDQNSRKRRRNGWYCIASST